jgi:hypothetical protein
MHTPGGSNISLTSVCNVYTNVFRMGTAVRTAFAVPAGNESP